MNFRYPIDLMHFIDFSMHLLKQKNYMLKYLCFFIDIEGPPGVGIL